MIKVNLLSPEKKEVAGGKGPDTPSFEEERENKISIPAAIIVAILTLGAIGYMYYEQSKTIDEKRKNLLELEATRKEKMIILDTIKELEKKKANLDKKYQLIEDLKARQQDVVRVMDEVLNALPEWVWFTKLTFSNRTLVINGKTSSNEQVSTFMNNMKGTQIFYDVEFPGSNRLKDGTAEIFSFGLKCKYREKEKEKENENDKDKTKEKDKNKDKTKSTDTNKKVG